jgi:hypothetical protein
VPSTHCPVARRLAPRAQSVSAAPSLLSPVTGENITTDPVADERWSLCAVCLQPHNLDQNQSITVESRSPSHLAVLLNLDVSFGKSPRPARCQARASPCSRCIAAKLACRMSRRRLLSKSRRALSVVANTNAGLRKTGPSGRAANWTAKRRRTRFGPAFYRMALVVALEAFFGRAQILRILRPRCPRCPGILRRARQPSRQGSATAWHSPTGRIVPHGRPRRASP